jgi:hypothetical protein
MKMPAKMKEDWVNALESGEYKQTSDTLAACGGYCCLGVLQMVVDGKVEEEEIVAYDGTVSDMATLTEPTSEWWKANGVKFEPIKCALGGPTEDASLVAELMSMNDKKTFRENDDGDPDGSGRYVHDYDFVAIAQHIREKVQTY